MLAKASGRALEWQFRGDEVPFLVEEVTGFGGNKESHVLLHTCLYKCSPQLAVSWPDLVREAGYSVTDLRRGVESNNVESYAGDVHDGTAKVRICIGPGGPAQFGPYSKDMCHLIVMYTKPLFFNKPGEHFKLAVKMQQLLLSAGAQLFSPDMRFREGTVKDGE